jgi:6-pyruvoyltetrahydropterin/6-carboxytetrahydropterin synthase
MINIFNNINNILMEEYGVEMENYFKFNSSHFVAYDGFREPLHGHNYKVSLKVMAKSLNSSSYVLDFDLIKPIMLKICSTLKHCLLLPKNNPYLKITEEDNSVKVICQDGSLFVFPAQDVKIIDTEQVSAECMAKYIAHKYMETITEDRFTKVQVKVFEDTGKCGIYKYKLNK